MRRIFAIFLLALLPLQFTWAAVAVYCGHETQTGVEHFGHHDHQHHADVSVDADLDADPTTTSDGTSVDRDGKTPGALDLDCGHCHGTCGMMLSVPTVLPDALLTASPIAALDKASGAHAPTRPERPQWLPLA